MASLCCSGSWHKVSTQHASAFGTGKACLRASAQGAPKGSIGDPTSALGEGEGGRGRETSWGGVGGRSRIALQCALNKCVPLNLISSDALFSDPICLSPGKFGDRLPSHCESIILQIYSRQTSHYNRCQQRNLSCRGTTNHEKEAEATSYANKTRPSPPHPHQRKQACCHNVFPHRLTIPRDFFLKERGKHPCPHTEAEAFKFIFSKLKVCNVLLKSSFPATKINICLFLTRVSCYHLKKKWCTD